MLINTNTLCICGLAGFTSNYLSVNYNTSLHTPTHPVCIQGMSHVWLATCPHMPNEKCGDNEASSLQVPQQWYPVKNKILFSLSCCQNHQTTSMMVVWLFFFLLILCDYISQSQISCTTSNVLRVEPTSTHVSNEE